MGILDQIPPFDYLSTDEQLELIAESELFIFHDQEVICDPASQDLTAYILLTQGQVTVIIEGKAIGYIHSPAYFGELSVFFDQPRSAKIVALDNATCLRIKGNDIRSFLKKNLSFHYAFSSALRYKQQIFLAYQMFVDFLREKMKLKTFSLDEILPLYKDLHPILHRGAADAAIDFQALQYALSKLPKDITSSSFIVLAEYLPETYQPLVEDISHRINSNTSKVFLSNFTRKIFCFASR